MYVVADAMVRGLEVNKPLANPRRSIQHHSHHHMTRMIMILIIMIMILIHSLVSNGDMEVVVCHKLMGSGEYIRAMRSNSRWCFHTGDTISQCEHIVKSTIQNLSIHNSQF